VLPRAAQDASLSYLPFPRFRRARRRSIAGVSDEEHAADLAELGRLVRTLGYDVTGTVAQRRDSLAAATVIGEGNLKELAELTGGDGRRPDERAGKETKAARDGRPNRDRRRTATRT